MADWLAIWGALTGTTGAAIAVRREVLINRPKLGMEHGVWHLLGNDPPNLSEAWLLVRLWNDGGQPLTVERVGVSVIPMWLSRDRQQVIVEPVIRTRVEIELGGSHIELHPGGPSHTFYAPLLGLIQAGLDVLHSPVSVWAMTSNRKEWTDDEEPRPIVPGRASEAFRADVQRAQDAIGVPPVVPAILGLPNEGPPDSGVIYA